jgi:hypothetical protein
VDEEGSFVLIRNGHVVLFGHGVCLGLLCVFPREMGLSKGEIGTGERWLGGF